MQAVERYLLSDIAFRDILPPDQLEETWLLLHSHHYSDFEVFGLGEIESFTSAEAVDYKMRTNPDWLLGHINYNPGFEQCNPSFFDNPPFRFFVPAVLALREGKNVSVWVHPAVSKADAMRLIKAGRTEKPGYGQTDTRKLRPHISREEYIQHVECLLGEIAYGSIYEANFCQAFTLDQARISPRRIYANMQRFTPNPFAAYYHCDGHFAMIASPERFLKKQGNRLLSQPIKGTKARDSNPEVDVALSLALTADPKERAENIMITDLVRNDLSRVSVPGTVQVEELCGVYSFPGVHQLVSSVSGHLRPRILFSEILKAAFPMGSMTGAPKASAMQLIEREESFKRELFSGSVGYITPAGDFDFNVVIRSLFYNSRTRVLSGATGGAVTAQSNPMGEYAESLTKAGFFQRCIEE
jgi:para-aminobenzoate synthetase component 1